MDYRKFLPLFASYKTPPKNIMSAQQALKNLIIAMLVGAAFMCVTCYIPFSFVANSAIANQWPIWLRATFVAGYIAVMLVVFSNMPDIKED